MVFLNRIYTKSGDEGQTSLGDGSRVSKNDSRIAAFGTVDELNSVIGLTRTTDLPAEFDQWLFVIQNDLFDLGADLCVPEVTSQDVAEDDSPVKTEPLRITAIQTERLESWIDQVNQSLEPLTSFVLPGGTQASAWLHLARTVARRAEVCVWTLSESQTVNSEVTRYLNRLSDLFFVLAQATNENGKKSVLWVPGQNRTSDTSN